MGSSQKRSTVTLTLSLDKYPSFFEVQFGKSPCTCEECSGISYYMVERYDHLLWWSVANHGINIYTGNKIMQ